MARARGKLPGFSAGDKESGVRGNQGKSARAVRTPAPAQTQLKGVQARCIKCKASRQMKDAGVVTFKNGKRGIQGVCVECGSRMTRFGILP